MKINESVVERKIVSVVCPRCGKEIKGTSKEQLESGIKIHNAFCGGKK